MDFFLFQAHDSFMRGFVEKPRQCAFCGQRGPAFNLEEAAPAAGETLPGPRAYGCESCLKAGKFGFEHDTDAGFVSASGLEPPPPPESQPIYAVSPDGQIVGIVDEVQTQTWTPSAEAVTTLFRTPNFHGWQQTTWLSHCHTFMAYIGEWEPDDFNEEAPDGDGRALFLAMVGHDWAYLWRKGTKKPRWGSGVVHTFECVLCGERRAYIDST